jgi:signal transduction histidine kinase
VNRIFATAAGTTAAALGLGLVLYVCQAIVRQHQGRLESAGAEGRGTTVTVALPRGRPGTPPSGT